jgi:hypothetical protein
LALEELLTSDFVLRTKRPSFGRLGRAPAEFGDEMAAGLVWEMNDHTRGVKAAALDVVGITHGVEVLSIDSLMDSTQVNMSWVSIFSAIPCRILATGGSVCLEGLAAGHWDGWGLLLHPQRVHFGAEKLSVDTHPLAAA